MEHERIAKESGSLASRSGQGRAVTGGVSAGAQDLIGLLVGLPFEPDAKIGGS